MSRNRIIILGILAAVVVIAATFPLWSPYFSNDVVDEAFPGLTDEERDSVRAMPDDEQVVFLEMSEVDKTMAADMVKAAMTETMLTDGDEMPADPIVLLAGSWIEIDPVHRAEGTATIYQVGEGRALRLEDFRVTNGPELHVLLAKNTPTTIFGGVGEDYVDLGQLKGNVGNQNYDIPADANLDDFQSVVIYCVPFGVVFSSAALAAV